MLYPLSYGRTLRRGRTGEASSGSWRGRGKGAGPSARELNPMSPRRLAPLLLLGLALACRAPAGPAPGPDPRDAAAIRAALDRLYAAFAFDAGGEADWDAIRAACAPGAAFLAPAGAGPARATGLPEFLDDFRAWCRSPEMSATGLHERILAVRLDAVGRIAHAWVGFEGFVPGEAAPRTRGVDSLQLVRDGGRWLVLSFTTQYEEAGAELPGRFVKERAGLDDNG